MSIPDYIVSRIVVDEQMQRQFHNAPDAELPESGRHTLPARVSTARHHLSASIHAIADRIEPQPVNPTPGAASAPIR
jgi:hypothetical protein